MNTFQMFNCILFFALFFPFYGYAEDANYLELKIPVMEGAKDISVEKNDQYFSKTLTYKLVLKDIRSVFTFYDNFFRDQGWKNFMEEHPGAKNTWSSRSSGIALDGNPYFAVSAMWQSIGIPVNGTI